MNEGYIYIEKLEEEKYSWLYIFEETCEENYYFGYGDLCRSNRQSLYVKHLQEKLGLRGDEADGYFGDKTESAVIAFQGDCNLIKDGIVGENTKYALINDWGG